MSSQRDYSYRWVCIDDDESWKHLRRELWSHHSKESLDAEFVQIKAMPTYEVALAFYANEPVGFVEVREHEQAIGTLEPVLYVEGIFVRPDFRGQGVAKGLISEVQNKARERGLNFIASDALIDNMASHAFHKAVGFQEKERVVHFLMEI